MKKIGLGQRTGACYAGAGPRNTVLPWTVVHIPAGEDIGRRSTLHRPVKPTPSDKRLHKRRWPRYVLAGPTTSRGRGDTQLALQLLHERRGPRHVFVGPTRSRGWRQTINISAQGRVYYPAHRGVGQCEIVECMQQAAYPAVPRLANAHLPPPQQWGKEGSVTPLGINSRKQATGPLCIPPPQDVYTFNN